MRALLSAAKRKVRQGFVERNFPYERYMRQHRCVFVHIPKTAGTSLRMALGAPERGRNHLPWWVYHQANPSRFASYFTFAFVRDPADRLVSSYRYLLRGGNQVEDLAVSRSLLECGGFEQFLKVHLENGWLKNHPLFWPQAWFVADHFGNVRVDFLGRLETISSDYEKVRQKLGIVAPLPRQNSTRESANFQISPEAKAYIHQLYAEDYELLGYG